MAAVSAHMTPDTRVRVHHGEFGPSVNIDGIVIWIGSDTLAPTHSSIVVAGELLKRAVDEALAPHRAALAMLDDEGGPNVVAVPVGEAEGVLRALFGDR